MKIVVDGDRPMGWGTIIGRLAMKGHGTFTPAQCPIASCDVFVVLVKDITSELLSNIQEAMEGHKQVLCLAKKARKTELGPLVVAGKAEQINLAYYNKIEEAEDKILRFVDMAEKSIKPSLH